MANRIKLAGTTANAFTIGLNGVTLNAANIGPYQLNLPANVGANTQVLSTDGTGNLSWVTQSGGGGNGTPGGSNTQIQFNDDGAFGGIPTVTWNGANISLGNVSNVKISGGANTDVIRTDGAGNLSFYALAQDLLVGTRLGPEYVTITNYQINVETRTGSVLVNIN